MFQRGTPFRESEPQKGFMFIQGGYSCSVVKQPQGLHVNEESYTCSVSESACHFMKRPVVITTEPYHRTWHIGTRFSQL